ncbi:hypothetical protein AVEN_69742-1 [Araneus ventricosus]|uniref:Uncharacterized protein n=1 Tax=Araneus ventricosus TaxID=182803 RepID=A0A4Y2CVK8_ARAVE|nr:hypothetical protein AVEN_69742-1 [Araneus ventricosus]
MRFRVKPPRLLASSSRGLKFGREDSLSLGERRFLQVMGLLFDILLVWVSRLHSEIESLHHNPLPASPHPGQEEASRFDSNPRQPPFPVMEHFDRFPVGS